MKTVLVIFGGCSTEHDISIITGVETLNAMPIKGFKVIPIYIRDKVWYSSNSMFEIKTFIHFSPKLHTKVALVGKTLYSYGRRDKLIKVADIDCALLATHGGDGENGSLQGFLEISDVPHTAASVKECAVCMDKALTKLALNAMGVKTVEGFEVKYPLKEGKFNEIEEKLGYPVIVKPASQGSSIGITIAKNKDDLNKGLQLAGCFGGNILVERALSNFTEINSAAVTINGELMLSEIEKPLSANDFLTYNDKYMGEGKGMSSGSREFPARISQELREKVLSTTKKVYKELNLCGIVRIDYLLSDNELYLNEINTIPGSLSYYLFDKISHRELLKGMVEESIKKGVPKTQVFKTEVLSNIGAKHK